MNEGIWVRNDEDEEIFIEYDDIEPDQLKDIIRPVGGFCYPAEDFLALPLTQTPFYVEGLLPKQGKALFYAPAKAGKSWFCIQAGRTIAVGEPCMGLATNLGRTLYIQCELGIEVMQERMRLTGKEYPNMYVGTTFSMKIDQPGGQQLLMNACEAIHPDVVILDPLYKMLLGDENEVADMKVALDFLDNVIAIYNCSILLVHHAGKDNSRRARGSSVLEDWVDAMVRITKMSPDNAPILEVKFTPQLMRHGALLPEFTAKLHNFEFQVDIGANPNTVESKVLSVFNTAKEVTPKLIQAMGIGSNTSVFGALKNLQEAKLIHQIKRGVYVMGEC